MSKTSGPYIKNMVVHVKNCCYKEGLPGQILVCDALILQQSEHVESSRNWGQSYKSLTTHRYGVKYQYLILFRSEI